jgi:hypothetical protein
MPTDEIETSATVIKKFLEAKKTDNQIDAGTLSAVQSLFAENKLSKVQLLRALESLREKAVGK